MLSSLAISRNCLFNMRMRTQSMMKNQDMKLLKKLYKHPSLTQAVQMVHLKKSKLIRRMGYAGLFLGVLATLLLRMLDIVF